MLREISTPLSSFFNLLRDAIQCIHSDSLNPCRWAGSKGKISKMAAVRLTEAHGHIVKRIQDSQAGKVAEIRVLESLGSAQGRKSLLSSRQPSMTLD
jgi:hypothetical protein